MNFKIPESLQTNRLVLRAFRNEDWRELHHYYSDYECMKYTTGRTLDEGETWRAMASMVGHWQLHGYGPYGIELKDTNQLIGICGLWYPNDWPETEIKWGLVRRHWGKGYAKESAIAVKNMIPEYLPNMVPISLIFFGNENSINLALSLNAKFEKEIEFRGQRALIYRHTY
jgi:RimJ/RimL family protein N-acetyltransferase